MPKISKVRIVNFEYNDGKRLIADELYDFANHDNDDALNVLINLANGGGKSVLVQLMMQPIIPKAKVAGRRIESFFTKLTDHCFVLLEWQKDNSSEKLLTGIAMAARASVGEDENARGMSVKYYTFYSNYASDRSNYSIVNLPLSKRENGRFVSAEFETVRTLAKRSGNALVYYRDDDNNAWKRKLEEYGLVQNEWRTMEKLNSEEGGFGKFFGDFKTSDQLIDNLLIPAIEGKLERGGSKEDHSLSTMLLSYAKQYAQRQDVLNNKEVYESYIEGLRQLLPQAEELWNTNDRLEKKISELFGLSDALSAGVDQLRKEQEDAEGKLEQLDAWKRHIEHEQVSAEFYQKKDTFEEADQQYVQAEVEKQNLDSKREAAEQALLIQECAGYYQKLQNTESEISALQDEIRRREQGASSSEELCILKYSAGCAVREALAVEEPHLAHLQEELADVSQQLEDQRTAQKEGQQTVESAKKEFHQLNGRLDSLRENTDRMVDGLGAGLFRRIDGLYGEDDLDDVWAEIEADRKRAASDCEEGQRHLSDVEETLASIPQKLADLSAEIRQKQQEADSANEALETYHTQEAAIRAICEEYNLDFSLRFTDSIRDHLSSELRANAAEQGETLRKTAVAQEEIQAAQRGFVHVPNAVIEYLNSTGVPYNTCENYLLNLVEEGKITGQQCLDILRNYPAAAYGVLMGTKAKEDFFSFGREKWLPAMVPIFSYEQMDKILALKQSFSDAIAFYSEASFSDRADYISLLNRQRDGLLHRQKLLSDAETHRKRQLAEVEAFHYPESWESAQEQMIAQLTKKAASLAESRNTLEKERVCLQQERQACAKALEESRQALVRAEDGLRQLQQIRIQIQREQEVEAQIREQKQLLRDAQDQLSQIEVEIDRLQNTTENLSLMIQDAQTLIQELHRAHTETEGAVETVRTCGQWRELIQKYRQLMTAMSTALASLRSQLVDKEARREEYWKELSKRGLEEAQYIHAVYGEDKEVALRKTVQELDKQVFVAGQVCAKALERRGVAQGELHSSEEKMASYGVPLDRSQVGADFQNRIQELLAQRRQVQKQKEACLRRENGMAASFERLSELLQGYPRPDSVAPVTLQEDFSTQCKTRTGELGKRKNELEEQEKLVSSELHKLQQLFRDTDCGVLDSIVSMTELLEKKLRGDRYFTLIDLIENSISNAQRAIGQIMTDLKEFEHHHLDLIHQCTLQGQRICDGLRQMSASSRVTVYDGKPKKQMLRFDMPESIDPESAAASIAHEIDQGTRELVARMTDDHSSGQEIENLAKRMVSSRNLLRKYIRQESIGVDAYKIDQNPQNAGYRSWKQTQVQNSGAEKFIVYFAVILSLMSYTREEIGGIRDKELRSVLILDNPFGATSSKHILEPMFAIARHFRVQMICLSDINKSDVINCFDIVIKAIVKKRPMSANELLTHEGNELIDHGFYRSEQLSLL